MPLRNRAPSPRRRIVPSLRQGPEPQPAPSKNPEPESLFLDLKIGSSSPSTQFFQSQEIEFRPLLKRLEWRQHEKAKALEAAIALLAWGGPHVDQLKALQETVQECRTAAVDARPVLREDRDRLGAVLCRMVRAYDPDPKKRLWLDMDGKVGILCKQDPLCDENLAEWYARWVGVLTVAVRVAQWAWTAYGPRSDGELEHVAAGVGFPNDPRCDATVLAELLREMPKVVDDFVGWIKERDREHRRGNCKHFE